MLEKNSYNVKLFYFRNQNKSKSSSRLFKPWLYYSEISLEQGSFVQWQESLREDIDYIKSH